MVIEKVIFTLILFMFVSVTALAAVKITTEVMLDGKNEFVLHENLKRMNSELDESTFDINTFVLNENKIRNLAKNGKDIFIPSSFAKYYNDEDIKNSIIFPEFLGGDNLLISGSGISRVTRSYYEKNGFLSYKKVTDTIQIANISEDGHILIGEDLSEEEVEKITRACAVIDFLTQYYSTFSNGSREVQ